MIYIGSIYIYIDLAFPPFFLQAPKNLAIRKFQVITHHRQTAGGQCPASRDQYPETAETSQAWHLTGTTANVELVDFFFPVKRTTENSDGTTFRLVCVCFFFPHFLAEAKNDMKLNYIVIFTSVLQVGELV